MSEQKQKSGRSDGLPRPKADPEWSKHSDATLRKAAQKPSPRFRITEGQRRALRSP